ncbi:hypothetical protein ONE63_011303 [Megalurothrips usitatus]|uniref:DUF4218 domain-containing protein n=1 Tax=Megalurothrips usitatus TaxID=439358 RepID=A0AAV7X5Z3_9NEOP|nr:hypothetical protein ONE63_011303 [Megalurothrips usitatus]
MFYKQYRQEDGSYYVPPSTVRRHARLRDAPSTLQIAASTPNECPREDESSTNTGGQFNYQYDSNQPSTSRQNECLPPTENLNNSDDNGSSGSETLGCSTIQLHNEYNTSIRDERLQPNNNLSVDLCTDHNVNRVSHPHCTQESGGSSNADSAFQEGNIQLEIGAQDISQTSSEGYHCLSNEDGASVSSETWSTDEESDNILTESLVYDIKLGNFRKLNDKFKLEKPLIPGIVETTKFECLFMVLNFSMQEGLSYNGTARLLKLINNIFGVEVIPDGITVFRSLFECDFGMTYHFYCPNCFYYFGDYAKAKVDGLECSVTGCGKVGNLKTMNDGNFFVNLPLAPQFKIFLETVQNAKDLLSYRLNREVSDSIRDVFDGVLYKNLSSNDQILSKSNNFSVTMNTDGSPVFRSGSNSMWPVQVRINELPPKLRFDSSNMFVCGVWFGSCEPNMNVFLSPYVCESQSLYESGFKWTVDHEEITSHVVTLNCCLDSRAKPDVQCFKQLHSYSGCCYCYHPGNLVNLTKNEIVAEPEDDDDEDILVEDLEAVGDLVSEHVEETNVEKRKREAKAVRYCVSRDGFLPNRTDEEIRRDMNASNENNSVVNGVTGISVLTLLPSFDMVNGFVIDYMHAVLLGVTKMFLKLWIESKFSKQPYSVRSKVHQINARLLKFAGPTNISRRPHNVLDYIHWKANELRAWLFFFAVCSLEGILPDVYLKHFSLLVSAIGILASESISLTELEQAKSYLLIFVSDVERLYGPAFMVHNTHLLCHLADCVKFNGPLWSHSAFGFETGNGVLVNLVKGTVGVISQIAKKYMTYRCVPLMIKVFPISDVVNVFCNSLVPKRMSINSTKCNAITVLGAAAIAPLSPSEVKALTTANLPTDLLCHHRMVINGVLYDSQTYPRKGNRSNNTVVKTSEGKFGVIVRIFVASNMLYVILRDINIDNVSIVKHDSGASCSHIKVCCLYPYGGLRVIRAKAVVSKCVFLKYNNSHYVAEFPNNIEKD